MSEKLEEIKQKIVPILRKSGVRRSAVFGSLARGEAISDSDIDILVDFSGGESLLDLIKLKIDLESVLNKKVDVITYKSLSPFLRDSILKDQIPVLS